MTAAPAGLLDNALKCELQDLLPNKPQHWAIGRFAQQKQCLAYPVRGGQPGIVGGIALFTNWPMMGFGLKVAWRRGNSRLR
jgi:hypothetical protein